MSAQGLVIADAARRFHRPLLESLVRTPIELMHFAGQRFMAKREDLQTTGSFKVRGALLRLAQIEWNRARFGVVCASAGNHGKGVAFAASRLGMLARVFVPEGTPAIKQQGISALGAEVIINPEPGYDACEARARAVATSENLTFVSPFDDPMIQAGNGGTIGLEILEDVPHVERVVIPVGGGGLATGLAATIHATHPLVEIIGVQSDVSPAMSRSLRDGRAHLTWPPAETLAEGLEGGIATSTFDLCKEHLAGMIEVPETAIARAMGIAKCCHGLSLEGSAAVVLAAVLERRIEVNERTVLVLTGHNVDPQRISWCVDLAREVGDV